MKINVKKAIFLLLILSSTSHIADAQWWSDRVMQSPETKLSDIKKEFEESLGEQTKREVGHGTTQPIKEGRHYHFDRWYWYQSRHTNEQGQLVSPILKWRKYQELKSRQNIIGQSKTTALDSSDWSFVGPSVSNGGYQGIGRVNVIEFHPTDTNTYWVGSAGGGAWVTHNDGQTWTSLYDDLPVLGVSDIDVNPLNPQVIYLATGDRDASDTYSIGLLKSYNSGATWDTTGLMFNLSSGTLIKDVIINPLDTNKLFVATSTNLYTSNDGGATFQPIMGGYFIQVMYNPVDTNYMYATRRISSTVYIYRSTDAGITWDLRDSYTNSTNIKLAVTPDNPAVVKAVVSNSSNGLKGIYNSTDSANTFTEIFNDNNCTTNLLANSPSGNSCSGQGWYDLAIVINPSDENEVLVGGVNTWHSSDGGHNWQIANQWTSNLPGIKVVHADKHYMAYHPNRANTLFECNDGGVYRTQNPTSSLWNDLSTGLHITQFYRVSTTPQNGNIVAGAQDNGSKMMTNGTHVELTGGDGMDNQMDPITGSIFYTSTQYGRIRRTTNNGGSFTTISNNIPGSPTGAWITPFVIHPQDPQTLIAGYQKLYVSNNRGNSWIGLNYPLNNINIERIAISPDSTDLIYTLAANNLLAWTRDGGQTWTTRPATIIGVANDIAIDVDTPGKLWVVCAGYNNKKVYSLNTFTNLFSDYSTGLPQIPVNCIIIDKVNKTKYVGTDMGVYYRDPFMTQWEPYNSGLPNTEVIDLSIRYTTPNPADDNKLVAATYGRGLWITRKHVNALDETNIITQVPFPFEKLKIYPNPNSGQFNIELNQSHLKYSRGLLVVRNNIGQTVWSGQINLDHEGKAQINLGTMAAGVYSVDLSHNGQALARERLVIH